jgi:hypothetical protein
LDSGFQPLHFFFGYAAYFIGASRNIIGAFKRLARGEIAEYTKIFDETRHLALSRFAMKQKNIAPMRLSASKPPSRRCSVHKKW